MNRTWWLVVGVVLVALAARAVRRLPSTNVGMAVSTDPADPEVLWEPEGPSNGSVFVYP